jgi:hypothetical protein
MIAAETEARDKDVPLGRKRYAAAAKIELGERSVASAQDVQQNGCAFFSDWIPFQVDATQGCIVSGETHQKHIIAI